jgi:hypothetical protein
MTMLELMLVLSLAAQPSPSYTKEQLAVGAIREVISAEAVHRKIHPQVGYACGLERLVAEQLLLDTWLQGTRLDGYRFRVWCDHAGTPQASYRASAVPVNRTSGASLTVCADETNMPRVIDGDADACFARGTEPK